MSFVKSYFNLLFVAVFLFALGSDLSWAEVKKVQVHLSGGVVNSYDAQQIRRLLKPWVDPKDVSFYTDVDKNGRQSPFSTVVEIRPRSAYVDIYDIVRRLKDQRFRGKHGEHQPLVVQTEATITGELFAYMGWSRSHIREAPFWRRWRKTSAVNHALDGGDMKQKIVFSHNEGYDKLRQAAGGGGQSVEISGIIAGFDGHYPVMSVRKFQLKP